jgi:hypothetical protein
MAAGIEDNVSQHLKLLKSAGLVGDRAVVHVAFTTSIPAASTRYVQTSTGSGPKPSAHTSGSLTNSKETKHEPIADRTDSAPRRGQRPRRACVHRLHQELRRYQGS